MGGGGSQTIEQRFNMSAINKSVYEQINKTQARASAAQATVQNLQMEFGDMTGCAVDLTQTVNASAISSSELTETTTTEIKNAITTEMQAAVKAQMEKVTEAGNLQFGDKQDLQQEVNMEIENIVENTIVTETLNESVAEQVTIQSGIIRFGNCKDSDIKYDQNVTAQIMAKTITTKLTDAIASSDVMNRLAAEADASQKTENKGIADIISKIFEGLTGPMKYGIIASVICCCLLVLVMIVIGLSPAGQKATGNLGAAGAARLGAARRF
jgi:hypothetical protein